MRMPSSLWPITISMLLCSSVLPAHELPHISTKAGAIGVDHRRAIEAHVRQSDHRILMLLRSATMSNIDSVLKSIDAIRRSNEECIERFERCREIDAAPSTAVVSKAAPPSGSDSKL
ncbi:hypothetical protein FQZ97_650650 [compost metagenome]